MKKVFIVLAAVAAFASCTKSDDIRIANDKAMTFSTFVGKVTKADFTAESLGDFVVYGTTAEDAYVFNRELVSKNGTAWTYANTQYWVAGNTYKFAAYAPSAAGISATQSYENGHLIFSDYDTRNQIDLLLAEASQTANENFMENIQPVGLNFRHALSKIRFDFSKKLAVEGGYSSNLNNVRFVISNVKVNGFPVQGDYANNSWTVVDTTPKAAYNATVDAEGTLPLGTLAAQVKTNEFYVVPQSLNEEVANVNMTVVAYDNAGNVISQSPEGGLTVNLPATTWEQGKVYVYTLALSPENINGSDDQPTAITFAQPEVQTWAAESSSSIL